MNYFVAGGMYFKVNKNEQNHLYQKGEYVFGLVHPNNELPYIWNDINDIKCVSHHASIYKLSDDLTHVVLVKDNGTIPSPHSVKLTLELQDKVKLAIKDSKNLKQ